MMGSKGTGQLYAKWGSFALLSHKGVVVRGRGEPTMVVYKAVG